MNNKKKQIHRYREQTDSRQRGRRWGNGNFKKWWRDKKKK